MRKVIASLIAALVLAFTGAIVGGRAQAAAISPAGLGTAADAVDTVDKVQFFYRGRRATAGTGMDGEVRAGIGAVMNGAAVLAGVVPLGGMAGADHLGRQSVRRRDQIVRELIDRDIIVREQTGPDITARGLIGRDIIVRELIGRETGRAAVAVEAIGRAPAQAVVAAAVVVAVVVAIVAASDPSLVDSG